MILTDITDDGHLTWKCGTCHTEQTAHVSHEHIQYLSPTQIALPPCPECPKQGIGRTRMSLNAAPLTEEQLAPPIIYYNQDGSIADVIIQGAFNLTKVVEHVEYRDMPTEWGSTMKRPVRVIDQVIHPVHQWPWHHQALAAHMEAHGKTYTPPDTTAMEQAQREQHKALILEVLREQGVVP